MLSSADVVRVLYDSEDQDKSAMLLSLLVLSVMRPFHNLVSSSQPSILFTKIPKCSTSNYSLPYHYPLSQLSSGVCARQVDRIGGGLCFTFCVLTISSEY